MKYGQFIKALKDKGVKVEDRTRHLKLSYGGKQTGCKRHTAEGYPLMPVSYTHLDVYKRQVSNCRALRFLSL